MEYKIINYDIRYKEKLTEYMHKIAPKFSNEYISYIVENAEAKEKELKSFIVVGEDNCIVGCHLFYNTKAFIYNEIKNVGWGHDTFLDEKVRRIVGFDFVYTVYNTPQFGIGLSEINRDIHHKLKTTFFDCLFNYVYPVCTLPLSLILRPSVIGPIVNLYVGQYCFKLVNDVSSIKIYNDGFWYKERYDIDFIRDADFFERRFVSNKVYDYKIYQLEGFYCYFVVRYVLFKGIPTLYVVDYRYDTNFPEQANLLLKASERLARKSKLGLVLLMSSDSLMANAIKKKSFVFRRTTDYIAAKKLKISSSAVSFITAADADVDFMRK